jgi:ligand-binding sensor domain-containing protein/serine phosphatase RsbU (regulator of sigma subunit)/ABC-type amino acid transport substrate-binding protein
MHIKRTIIILLAFCFISLAKGTDLDEIKKRGEIRIAFTSDDFDNINYPLAVEFAKYLNVKLIPVEITWDEAFMLNGQIPDDVKTNPDRTYTPDAFKRADIICSTFTVLDWRKKLFGFAETLHSAELLIINKKEEQPKDFNALIDKSISFQRGTTFERHLKEINNDIGGGIRLNVVESGSEAMDLLLNGQTYGIVLDADEALNFNARSDYKFKIAYPISDVTKTAWAVEKNNNPLIQEVESFFETIANNGVLDEIFSQKFELQYSTYIDIIHKNLRYERMSRDLDGILASKKLVVALRDRNFIWRESGQKQFMHALAEEFADYLGVSLEILITPYFPKYWETETGDFFRDSSYSPEWFNYFDVACEVFAPLDWRLNKIQMVPVYPSEYTVIARKESDINSIENLNNFKGVTGKQTVYEDMLTERGITNYYHEVVNNFLTDVDASKADYTILYNSFYELVNFPNLESKFALGDLNVCWGIRDDQPQLKKELERFIKKSSENGLIKVLLKALQGNTLQSPDEFINSYYESFQTGQLPYVNIGADDGLPQEDVFAIFQDQRGYIWFGTNSGAVRYNGREMFVFNDQQGLPSNTVRDIKQDSAGNMYFATTNGVSLLVKDSISQSYFKGVSFKKIFIDTKNNKWLVGSDGVYLLAADGTTKALNSEFPEIPEFIYNITEDKVSDGILFATTKGVFLYDKENNKVSQLNDKDCFSVFIDVNDSVWLSTKSGLLISDRETLLQNKFESEMYNLNSRLEFPVEVISEITTNKFGSVWLISDSKIFQIISTDESPIVYEQEIGIKNNKILSFLVDKEDNIWIGFSGGLQRLANRKGLRNFYPNTINSYIYSVFQDKKDRIWATSNNGIFYFDTKLHEYTPKIGLGTGNYLGTPLPNGNILLANNYGLYEINSTSLGMTRHSLFPQLSLSHENLFVSSTGQIFLMTGINGVIYYFPDFYSQPIALKNRNTSNVFQLEEYEGQIIGGNNNGLVKFNGTNFELVNNTSCNIWSVYAQDSILYVGTDCGVGRIQNEQFDQLEMITYAKNLVVKSIVSAKNKNYLWIGTNKGFSYYNLNTNEIDFSIDTKDGLSGDEITSSGLFLDNKDLLWVGTYHGLSNFNIRAKATRSYAPLCNIESIELNGKDIDIMPGGIYKHNENNFVFEISALSFTDEKSVDYEFYLRGTGNNYSSYHRGKEFKAYYNNLPAGKYTFIYKAKGKNNIWGYAESFEFTIRKAWYTTWVFRVVLVLLIVWFGYLFYKIRIRTIQAQKERLELQVRERTHELEEANAEIEAQRDLATEQRDQIVVQREEILDSIHYAERIQQSMLPSSTMLKTILPDHFILFKPRDFVSGDFYWAQDKEDYVYFTAADCTGHGVPGAFMSMLGMAFLNEIVNKFDDIDPHEVLNQLRKYIIKAMNQIGQEGEAKDGMDMVVCKLNKKTNELKYACANNPLFLIRDGELIKTKGDPMPVSIHLKMDPFTPHTVQLQPGDSIYIFSDGYADQFGGPKMKKFMQKQFRELLTSISKNDMKKQGQILDDTIEKWKGWGDTLEQIDDIVVIGVKF